MNKRPVRLTLSLLLSIGLIAGACSGEEDPPQVERENGVAAPTSTTSTTALRTPARTAPETTETTEEVVTTETTQVEETTETTEVATTETTQVDETTETTQPTETTEDSEPEGTEDDSADLEDDIAKLLVTEALARFEVAGEAVFEEISDEGGLFIIDEFYVFVTTPEGVVAHAAEPSLVGSGLDELPDEVAVGVGRVNEAASPEGAWTWYELVNPATGVTEFERTWVVSHKGFNFAAAGHRQTIEEVVKLLVAEAVERYKENGEAAFEEISDPQGRFINGEIYVGVTTTDGVSRAHPADPSLVGRDIFDIQDSDGRYVVRGIVGNASEEGGWSTYRFTNPVSGVEEPKRYWAVLHDGFVFGSGYYLTEAEWAQQIVTDSIALYEKVPEQAFATISDVDGDFIAGEMYAFVVNSSGVVAHAADPSLVGVALEDLPENVVNWVELVYEAASLEGGWVEYEFVNPVSGVEELKSSWAVLRDGYAFAAGYYYTEAEVVKRMVADAIARYDMVSEQVFDEISDVDGDFIDGELYVFVVTSSDVVAHAADPSLVGVAREDLPESLASGHVFEAASLEGGWVDYEFVNPVSGVEELKSSWAVLHDGYAFAAGYYYTETEVVKRMVAEAIARYRLIGEAAYEEISDPDGKYIDGEFYVFVFTPEGVSLAHPADPSLVGRDIYDLQDSKGNYIVRGILESASTEGAWSSYRFGNPVTGVEEPKRSWSVLHDGIVFGSGYYITEGEWVQQIVADAIALYDERGEAAFADISDPDGDFIVSELYGYVLTPEGEILAHPADPSLVGRDLYDLQDSRGTYVVQGILESATPEGGWSDYRFSNPITGLEEPKRSWSVLHDGFVFGSGYYISEIGQVQAQVERAVDLYGEIGDEAFAEISNAAGPFIDGEIYTFALSASGVSLAHAANPSLVGTDRSGARDSRGELFIPRIIEAATPEGRWVTYRRLNPVSGQEELKRAWVVEVGDGAVIGSGYYTTEQELVKLLVAEAISRYGQVGDAAFEEINDPDGFYLDGEYYVYVFTGVGVMKANPANPSLVGNDVADLRDSDGTNLLRAHLAKVSASGNWVDYRFANPLSGEEEQKRSWAVFNDGLIFGAGIYLTTQERVQLQVSDAISRYGQVGVSAFEEISNPAGDYKSGEIYTFVLDLEGVGMANAASPSLVGRNIYNLKDSSGSFIIQEILESATPEGAWTTHLFVNPVTGREEPRRTWAVLHDDLVFGSGYYITEEDWVRLLVEKAIARYEEVGSRAFAEISRSDGDYIEGSIYVFGLSDDGRSLAHAANPSLVGRDRSGIRDSRGEQFIPKIIAAADEDGGWVSYRRLNPVTGIEELKRSWVVEIEDGLLGAGYYLTPAEMAQKQVEEAIALYDEIGAGAFRRISDSQGDFIDGEFYVYVLTPEGVARAHPANPSLVGRDISDIRDSDGSYVVRGILRSANSEGAWSTYRFANPATGEEEPKRSWAVRHDGFVFGSGYYITEEEWVRLLVDKAVTRYEQVGSRVLAEISNPNGGYRFGDIYVYAINDDGEVLAHAADVSLVGEDLYGIQDSQGVFILRADLQAATSLGGWTEYLHVNPANGKEELKRVWVVRSGDLVFASGLYTSEIELVKSQVKNALDRYEAIGEAAFSEISNPRGDYIQGDVYTFALSSDGRSLAHAANPSLVGKDRSEARDSRGELFIPKIVNAATQEGSWVYYRRLNPVSGEEELKRSWVVSRDGFVMGSGYYLTEAELPQTLVADAIALFEEEGQSAFVRISVSRGRFREGKHYVFALTSNGVVRAHTADESLLNRIILDRKDSDGRYFAREILDRATASGGWIEFRSQNPETGREEPVRAWVVRHDRYVFGSGHYITEEEWAQQKVEDAIALYKELGTDAFEEISDPSGDFISGEIYAIVYTPAGMVLAHPADPDLVGTDASDLEDSKGVNILNVVSEAASAEGGWAEHRYANPVSGRDELKRVWVVAHDGLIFAAGYYFDEDQLAQQRVAAAIDLYKKNGERAYEDLMDTDGDYVDGGYYVFAFDREGISLANASNPEMVGTDTYDLQDSDGVYITREILVLAVAGGGWLEYRFVHPETRLETRKRSWVELHDGIVFGSGYYLDE